MISLSAVWPSRWRTLPPAWRADLIPGTLAALLTLPQGIALSALAGMPVEHGLYLSLLPALVATLVGHTPLSLSGPNTATSILLYASATTVATPGSPAYVNQVLLTTLFAAIFQFLFYFLRAGKLFLELPASVSQGVVAGTGLLILFQQLGPLFGIVVNGQGPIESVAQALFHDDKNYWPLLVGSIAIAAGLMAKRLRLGRYGLLVALVVGWLAAEACDAIAGSGVTGLERLGNVSLSLDCFSYPHFNSGELIALLAAINNGLAVAAVGALQAAIMARTCGLMMGRNLSANRDILGQAAMNLLATFTTGLAGATSLNRTLANLQCGATSRAAGIICVLLLVVALALGHDHLARIPMAAVAGVLVLVGFSMLGAMRSIRWRQHREALEFLVTVGVAVFTGLFNAVLVGACLAFYHRALAADGD